MCRIDEAYYDNISGPAACLIRMNDLLLALSYEDKYRLPRGENQDNEAAQCTAHRVTWQKTGFNVVAGKLLGLGDDGTRYYQCNLSSGFEGQVTEFPLPPWSIDRPDAIILINPFELQPHQWQDPRGLISTRNMFNQIYIDSSTTNP